MNERTASSLEPPHLSFAALALWLENAASAVQWGDGPEIEMFDRAVALRLALEIGGGVPVTRLLESAQDSTVERELIASIDKLVLLGWIDADGYPLEIPS
jgi:hypothetical protein